MPFVPGLTFVDQANFNPWKAYAWATLIRIASVGDRTALDVWRQWSGGTYRLFLDPDPAFGASRVAIVGDGDSAIVAYAGTQDSGQMLGQICGSVQLSTGIPQMFENGGQRLIYLRRRDAILGQITSLNPGERRVLCIGTSLGGACAVMLAMHFRLNQRPTAIFTTGQPRVGNSNYNALLSNIPWLRLINGPDLVTAIPPESDMLNILVQTASGGRLRYDYSHGGVGWGMITGDDGNVTLQRDYQPSTTASIGQTVLSTVQTREFTESLTRWHAIENYIRTIRRLNPAQALNAPDLTGLHSVNTILDRTLPQPPRPPVDSPLRNREVVRMQDPNAVINDGDPPITIPPADVGRRAETRRVAVVPNPPQHNTAIFRFPQLEAIVAGELCKCTFNFRQLGQAWSETYVNNYSSIDSMRTAPSVVSIGKTKIEALADSMMGMRGPQCSLTSVRMSLFTIPRIGPTARMSYLMRFTPAKVGTWTTPPKDSDLYNTCIVLQMVSGVAGPPKLTHCRGFPDSYVTRGGEPFASLEDFFGEAWDGDAGGFSVVLPGDGWRWVGRGTTREGAITNVVQDDAGTVSITTSSETLLAGLPIGLTIPLRIKGITKPKALNGKWPFTIRGLSNITSKKLFGILPWDEGAHGMVVYDPQLVYSISRVRYNNIGSRLAGRPSDLQRGRQPNRSRN